MSTPPFIVLEGPDGSGTTKHAALLVRRLQERGIPVCATAEPSNGPIGSSIRGFLASGDLPPDALQLLFTADRADHVRRDILPALSRGEAVVCDRYFPSTLAYGQALGLPYPWLQSMNTNFIQPTCVLVTLPPFAVCRERLAARAAHDSLESEELQRSVYDHYAAMVAADPTMHAVDTSGPKEDVHETIWSIVAPFFPA